MFDKDYLDAFKELKKRLTQAPVLAYYNPDRPSRVETDALDGVVAGIFS